MWPISTTSDINNIHSISSNISDNNNNKNNYFDCITDVKSINIDIAHWLTRIEFCLYLKLPSSWNIISPSECARQTVKNKGPGQATAKLARTTTFNCTTQSPSVCPHEDNLFLVFPSLPFLIVLQCNNSRREWEFHSAEKSPLIQRIQLVVSVLLCFAFRFVLVCGYCCTEIMNSHSHWPHPLVSFFLFYLLIHRDLVSSPTSPTSALADGRENSVLDPSTAATSSILGHGFNSVYLPLRRKQRRLVRDNPGVLAAVARGLKLAITECQYQFRDRRWDCPTTDFLKGKSIFGRIVRRGTPIKESLSLPGLKMSSLTCSWSPNTRVVHHLASHLCQPLSLSLSHFFSFSTSSFLSFLASLARHRFLL